MALCLALPASAHVWKTDGNMSVLLHVNPNDDPIAGKPADLWLQVTDTTNRFNAKNCQCSVSISEGGKTLLSAPLSLWNGGPSIFAFSVPFTFPDPAVYGIVVTGAPEGTSKFQNFRVQYNLRVERNPDDPSADSGPEFYLIMAGLAVFIICTVYLWYREVRPQ